MDRIFLLCGQVGVVSGSYVRAKAAIVWDTAVEYPADNSTLPTRPLGMAVANGRLYFSVGGHLYVRQDGPRPTWSLAFTIPGLCMHERSPSVHPGV